MHGIPALEAREIDVAAAVAVCEFRERRVGLDGTPEKLRVFWHLANRTEQGLAAVGPMHPCCEGDRLHVHKDAPREFSNILILVASVFDDLRQYMRT
ncbi:MAG: hypothetical protein VX475_16055, partial [Myxococcota bacterium]|nr:hypothetical protein [Myxococcota bacterium]